MLKPVGASVGPAFLYVALTLAACAGSGTVPPPAAPSKAAPADAIEAFRLARQAARAGDDAGVLAAARAADRLVPDHPLILLQLARAYARAGDPSGALATLERLLPTGAAGVAEDPAFAAIRGDTTFRALAARLDAAAAPVVRGDTAFIVPGPDLLPESIAYDPVERTFYLGSLSGNAVVRVGEDGHAHDFARVGEPGSVIGIKVDASRRLLWAASFLRDAAGPETYTGAHGRTALLAFDLATGALVRRYAPEDGDAPHFFNDVAIAGDGDVFVTDIYGHAVWQTPDSGERLVRVFGGSNGFHWPNGIALSPDETRLYVAHLEGISVLDRRTGRAGPLAHPPSAPTQDTDGLYACGDALVAVQRGAGFARVMRLRLAAGGDRILAGEVLERRHPAYAQPTTGVLVGDSLYYIANSRAGRLRPDGTLAPTADGGGTVVLRVGVGCDYRRGAAGMPSRMPHTPMSSSTSGQRTAWPEANGMPSGGDRDRGYGLERPDVRRAGGRDQGHNVPDLRAANRELLRAAGESRPRPCAEG